jgi:hypothetical protein
MPKSLCVFIALILASPLASAEIFKCRGPDGKVIYQNFSCEIDSIGSHATATPPPDVPPPEAGAPEQAKPKAAPVTVAALPKSTGPTGEPRIGMTFAEVKNSTWGEPERTEGTELASGLVDIWYWGGTRRIQFDYKGHVFQIDQ